MDIKDKKKAINKAIAAFQKKFKLEENESVRIGFMSDNEDLGNITHLATGNTAFDTISKGGFVEGQINVVYGEEGSGKSTLFLMSIAYQQKINENYIAAYLDNEKTFDRAYAISLGVDLERLVFGRFETNEQSVDFCLACLDMGINALYIDTLQALAPEGELRKGAKDKSVADNTMALIPRMYSQFLRMYTSKSVGTLTLILGSQVRMDLGAFIATAKDTGGNAIKHYNILTVELKKLSIQSNGNWPAAHESAPAGSFPVQYKIIKSKMLNRFKGCTILSYFVGGKVDRKFNILGVAKEIGLTDGKKLGDASFKGFYDMVNRIDDSLVDNILPKLIDGYSNFVMGIKEEIEETDDIPLETIDE